MMGMEDINNQNFRRRILQEDFPAYSGPPSNTGGITDHLKKNWKNYLGGAALGAGAMMLGDHLSDGVHDFNDEMHNASDNGNYMNTWINKAQSGLEHLKTGDHTSSVGVGNNNVLENPTSTGSGSSETTNIDKLKSIAYPYASNNDSANGRISSMIPFYGEGYASHLKNFVSGNADVGAADLSQADIARENYAGIGDKENAIKAYKIATQKALSDGVVSPAEHQQLSAMHDKITEGPGLIDKAKGFIYGDDTVAAERQAEQEVNNAMNWAHQNGFDFLLNGNTDDDLAFFRDAQQKYGKIPDQLMPIYRAVMNKVQNG
jgi:hypothetical protein